ncbi:MAG: oligosaccharide flippase family protein [Saprospiraceae bacterium]|nr:oligosaccharide flippase family protein [Saprospiraceae bacterium]
MSRPVKVISLALGDGINIVLNFILVPFLARQFDVVTYGTYAQCLLVVGFMATLMSMGLNNILLKDMAVSENKQRTFYNNLATGSIVGILGALLLAILSQFIALKFDNPNLNRLLLIYTSFIPVSILLGSCSAALIYNGKNRLLVLSSVGFNAIRLLAIFLIIKYLHSSLSWVFFSLTMLGIFNLIFYLRSIDYRFEIADIKLTLIRQQLWEAAPLGLTIAISSVYSVVDGFFISFLLGVENYAVYRNGAMYIPMIMNLFTAINTIFLPDISKIYNSGNYDLIIAYKKKIAMLFVFLVYPVVLYFLFYAHDLVVLIFSSKYESSSLVFLIFNITLLFRLCNTEDIFLVSNKTNMLPVFYAMACVLSIIMNYILIHYLGLYGAAIASVTASVLLILMVSVKGFGILSHSFTDVVPWKLIFSLFFFCSVLIAGFKLVGQFYPSPYAFLFYFIPYSLVTYVVLLRLGFMDPLLVRNILESVIKHPKLIYLYDRVVG